MMKPDLTQKPEWVVLQVWRRHHQQRALHNLESSDKARKPVGRVATSAVHVHYFTLGRVMRVVGSVKASGGRGTTRRIGVE